VVRRRETCVCHGPAELNLAVSPESRRSTASTLHPAAQWTQTSMQLLRRACWEPGTDQAPDNTGISSADGRLIWRWTELIYKVRTTLHTSVYLSHHMQLCDNAQTLCSVMTTRLSAPFVSTAPATYAFCCSALATCNSLPMTATHWELFKNLGCRH